MKELSANKTKIFCTIGPASESQQVMEQGVDAVSQSFVEPRSVVVFERRCK